MAATLRSSPHSVGGLRRSFAGSHAPFLVFLTPRRSHFEARVNLSFKEEERIQEKRSWKCTFASNTNRTEGSRDGDGAAQGPPLLTILAGLLVFLLFCWLVGSFVMWIIGLIFHSPPLK